MHARRTLRVVFVPGLSANLLDGGHMPRLAEAVARRGRRARLKCSFPCLPSVVEQTVLTGVPPGRHGVLGRLALPHAPGPTSPPRLPERLLAEIPGPERSLRCIHRDELASAVTEHGPNGEALWQASRALDEALAETLATIGEHEGVLLVGGPGYLPVTLRLDLAELLAGEPAARFQVEGSVARILVPERSRPPLRDRLLAQEGIERILSGRGLALWGAEHPQAGDLLALAERFASFESGAAACGHPDVAAHDHPLALALGGRPADGWPAEIHDYRLAPTAAAFLGLSLEGFADTALPF